jgi:hypothetical protein
MSTTCGVAKEGGLCALLSLWVLRVEIAVHFEPDPDTKWWLP